MVQIVTVENKKIIAIDSEYRLPEEKFITFNVADDMQLDIDWFVNDISTASYLKNFLDKVGIERNKPITLFLDSNYSSISGLFNIYYLNLELRTIRDNLVYYEKQLKNVVGFNSFEEVINSTIDKKDALNVYVINDTNIKVVTDILTNDLNRREIILVLDKKLPLYSRLNNLDYDIIDDIEYANANNVYRNILYLRLREEVHKIFLGGAK